MAAAAPHVFSLMVVAEVTIEPKSMLCEAAGTIKYAWFAHYEGFELPCGFSHRRHDWGEFREREFAREDNALGAAAKDRFTAPAIVESGVAADMNGYSRHFCVEEGDK